MKYLNLDYELIRKEYPHTVRKIEMWYEGLEHMNWNLLSEKHDKQELVVQLVSMVIQHDPRKLYDFLDEQGCRIFITDFETQTGSLENPMFYYYNSVQRISKSAESRIEAERGAFMDAFKLLNENDKKEQVPSTHSDVQKEES